MNKKIPSIIVTGASGFIGRNFIEATADNFKLFCIARRSQKVAGISEHPNIYWIQADIGKIDNIEEFAQDIIMLGGADYIVHLAGYYDFTLKDNIEYQNTNINGTRNILELAKYLKVKHFIFSSSLAACNFSKDFNTTINESSPLNENFPYARSKKIGEALVLEYSTEVPCSVVRLAAAYSDWCEYPPLFSFLKTWLSDNWNARILGGKGESAITYIHVSDLISLFLKIIQKHKTLKPFNTFIASASGTISHKDIFEISTKYFFSKKIKPLLMPRILANIGVHARFAIGKITDSIPFEKPWMLKYIDKKLVVENSYTRKMLDWQVTRRYDLTRRLLPIIEKMKSFPLEWTLRNKAIISKTVYYNSICASEMLTSKHTQLENEVIKHILDRENFPRFRFFMQMRMADLLSTVQLTFRLLISLIRNKDIEDMQFYFRRLANYLFVGGFDINEIRNYIQTTESVLIDNLKCNPDCREFYNETINYLSPVFQLLIDETEEYYEKLKVTQLKKSNSEDIYINNFEVKDHYPIKRTVPDQSISFKSMQFDNLPSFSIN
ncbi:MAG: NAD(P)-dependent oxidoreductase [Bacteroidales bacterium]|jgi:nucleoside-diphosphate-sugar epimerase